MHRLFIVYLVRSIKIAPASFAPAQVLENLTSALPSIVKNIKGGWENVQSLHIKTSASVSLPIWSCDLGAGEGGRWSGLVGASEESEGSEENEESEESEEEPAPVQKEGKKRAAGVSPPTTIASKKAKTGSPEVAKAGKVPALLSKQKTTTIVSPLKSGLIPTSQGSTKKPISHTPIVEESSSDEELPPKLESKVKSRSTPEAKKTVKSTGIEQKKTKLLAGKRLGKGGSKTRLIGVKKLSR